jgi:hypothetical protein
MLNSTIVRDRLFKIAHLQFGVHDLLIPLDVAHHSGMISPTVPI